MSYFNVVFKGGVLGGEVRTLSERDVYGIYRVPVMPRSAYFISERNPILLPRNMEYEVEEYRYEGEKSGNYYVMRYQRPNYAQMQTRVKQLEEELWYCRHKDRLDDGMGGW